MKKHLSAAAAALSVSLAAYPALANQITRDDGIGLSFADSAALMRTAALHQPSFKTTRRCSLAHECATVEFAVRANEDGSDYFIYPDKAPKDVIWCFVDKGHVGTRLCQKAGTEPRTTVTWMEAYFPQAGEFREITYGGGHIDPDCAALQHSKYEMDDSYAACVVRKLDAAPPVQSAAPPVQKQGQRSFNPNDIARLIGRGRPAALTAKRDEGMAVWCRILRQRTFATAAEARQAKAQCQS